MARRKISDQPEDHGDLPDLTPQQMHFVEGILSGKTASDAYRSAYDVSTMGTNSIWVEASRLRSNVNVALWLATARKAGLGHATITLDQHIRRLDRLQEIAVESGNVGAAVQAEQLIGKASGHYVEQVRDLTEHDPLKTLAAIAELSPALARELAKREGIEWETER